MLSYIELKNFKSLTDFKIDFRAKGGVPKKVAFIYGENGSGKTNLVRSILFISQTLDTLSNYLELQHVVNNEMPDFIVNMEDPDVKEDVFRNLIAKRLPSLSKLIEETKTIGSSQDMSVKIGFYIDGIEGCYEVIFDDKGVVFEELRYLVNQRVGALYTLQKDSFKFSPSLVMNSKYKGVLKGELKKYWGKHTFLSILTNEMNAKSEQYIEESLSASFISVYKFLAGISLSCKNSWGNSLAISTPINVFIDLVTGTINKSEEKELFATEGFINSVFTQLYSDIKGVFYKLKTNEDTLSYELYVRKLIGGKVVELPFTLESTGTQKLLGIIEFFLLSLIGGTVLVDEMDSDIHDLLISECIELFVDSLPDTVGSQFIATTHNTYLMEMSSDVLPKDSIYVLTVDAYGKKEALSLDRYNFRTQKNHNIRSKYLKGDYDGIPYTGYFDFNELVDDLKDSIGKWS